ncbi:haloacid dehalogenase-like hydrolase [Polyplosphaeria fusca]|uniref:Haloacid dehalogenase-like hydrolase n=1 Tax=Polyplosphaeria fusca TaxID=682080 RepID=A0A9P4R5Z3_9PLEO|nr:haloacid dehalogenase-like hydrolase [Polyplosphaeria fusca]
MSREFPSVRACIFDVDGTLINSEDIYTDIYNSILCEYGRPDYPWRIKATQQSRGTPGTNRLLAWAQVPLTTAEWKAKEKQHTHLFKQSKLLPGVESLLTVLHTKTSPPIKLSLASSAGHQLFALKTSHIPAITSTFTDPAFQVFGDDPEMSDSKKKPEPDIFLLALERLNAAAAKLGEHAIVAEECLVFEDSIAGVEAARRAGMRVVWVPHPGLAEVCDGREMEVLMGRTEKDGQVPDFGAAVGDGVIRTRLADGERVMSDDGFAEMRVNFEDFPFQEYGINVS